MDTKLISALCRREASVSVGPSTARGMGPKGTIATAREYLASLNLASFRKKTEKEFRSSLNQETLRFLNYLPRGAKHWGAARKFLNIFLRGVVYNRFLCEHYKLYCVEPWLELPLDSHVAKGLRGEMNGKSLPRWRTVIRLDWKTNKKYQEFATVVAGRQGTYRVHLDIIYWRRDFVVANTLLNRTRKKRCTG